MTDWFFYQRVIKFMDMFFVGVLKGKDYWVRYEYQHRGSLHIHSVAWIQDAPHMQNVLVTDDLLMLIKYIDRTVSTIILQQQQILLNSKENNWQH